LSLEDTACSFSHLRARIAYCSAIEVFCLQIVEYEGRTVALLDWGPGALKLADRDEWIGWSGRRRADRRALVVNKRHRADYYEHHGRPKKLWLYPLHPSCQQLLQSIRLPEAYARAVNEQSPERDLPIKSTSASHTNSSHITPLNEKAVILIDLKKS
jgi:hypothetical protein